MRLGVAVWSSVSPCPSDDTLSLVVLQSSFNRVVDQGQPLYTHPSGKVYDS